MVNNQVWQHMINHFIAKHLSSMLCIGKVHLFVQFVQFGLTFQQEFALLHLVLSKNLQVKASTSAELSHIHTSVPVLFIMMATCNQKMVEQIETLSGLSFHRSSNMLAIC
jgi:hypothetical protein